MPPLPGVFLDYFAPIVCNGAEEWRAGGLPSPFEVLKGKNRDPGVTNTHRQGHRCFDCCRKAH
jgi:hypothetical protein